MHNMKFEEFYRKLRSEVEELGLSNPSLFWQSDHFISYLKNLSEDSTRDSTAKMTCMSVLFEGFYQSLENNNALKNRLSLIRLERWGSHYGTPTITFLLTYNSAIEKTKHFFALATPSDQSPRPWEIVKSERLVLDQKNDVLVDEEAPRSVAMPAEDEKTGQFLKTHNPSGGFTTTPCDPVSQKFIDYASEIAGKEGTVLEIGAAFGAASLQALAKGAKVFCNDIDPSNLAVVRNRHLKTTNSHETTVTGDDSKLVLVPGSFPDELAGLPKDYFDAILICRVLHFFTGDQIEKSLEQLSTHLKSGGKLFVVCETPYLKNWQRFIPEFERRAAEGVKWPGEITNPADYESSGRAASLPKFVHWITKEVLEKSLIQKKFGVEHLSYIDRCGQFPKDLLLDGRESIGAVAAKPY